MTKNQYLLDRYSQSLTKYDIQNLFHRLIKIKGSVAAATKVANIKRKTYYDWGGNSEDVKPSTKRKILDACLENDLFGTIEFLVKKDELNYLELLERYVSMINDQITSETNPSELAKWNIILEKFIKTHIGSIQDSKTISLDELLNTVNTKSASLGVKGIAKDVKLIQPSQLSEKFVDLLDIFRNKPTLNCDQIVNVLDLPKEFVTRACEIYGYTPIIYSTEATRNDYSGTLSPLSLNRFEHNKAVADLRLDYIAARRE